MYINTDSSKSKSNQAWTESEPPAVLHPAMSPHNAPRDQSPHKASRHYKVYWTWHFVVVTCCHFLWYLIDKAAWKQVPLPSAIIRMPPNTTHTQCETLRANPPLDSSPGVFVKKRRSSSFQTRVDHHVLNTFMIIHNIHTQICLRVLLFFSFYSFCKIV